MPPRLRAKITLVETVTIAPGVRELVEAGLLKVTGAFKDLFGEMDEGLHQPTVDRMGVEELEAKLESTTLAPQTPVRCLPRCPARLYTLTSLTAASAIARTVRCA